MAANSCYKGKEVKVNAKYFANNDDVQFFSLKFSSKDLKSYC